MRWTNISDVVISRQTTNKELFMTNEHVLPTQDAKRLMPVHYNIFCTTFIFGLSNIRKVFAEELDAAFDPTLLSAPPARYADDGLRRASMPMYLRVKWDNAAHVVTLCFSKDFSTKAARHSIHYCERTCGWKSDGFPVLRLRRYLNHVAKLANWDRAVFQGVDGKPTTEPKFTLERVGSEIRIKGTLMGMEESDFRSTYGIGDPKKRQ